MCDMSSHFASSSAGGGYSTASGHDQYTTNGYHDRHLQPPLPPPSLPSASGSAHHQQQYAPLQYGHHYPRYVPSAFERLPNDGTNAHSEPSPNHNFAWSSSSQQPPATQQLPPHHPPSHPHPSAQVFGQPYDATAVSCANRGSLTPPHDSHLDSYANCKMQSGLDSGLVIPVSSPPPHHHNSHQIYPTSGIPSPGPQNNDHTNSLIYPWMRSQFGEHHTSLKFDPLQTPLCDTLGVRSCTYSSLLCMQS